MSFHPFLSVGTGGGDIVHYKLDGTIGEILQYPDDGDLSTRDQWPTHWNNLWPIYRLKYHSSGDHFLGQEDAGTVLMVNGADQKPIISSWVEDYAPQDSSLWGQYQSPDLWWDDMIVHGNSLWVVASSSTSGYGTVMRQYTITPHVGLTLAAEYAAAINPPPYDTVHGTEVTFGRQGIYNLATFDGYTFYGASESSIWSWYIGDPEWTFVGSIAAEMAVPATDSGTLGQQHIRSMVPMIGYLYHYNSLLIACYGEQEPLFHTSFYPKLLVVRADTAEVTSTYDMSAAPTWVPRGRAGYPNIWPFGACFNARDGYIYTGDSFYGGEIWRITTYSGEIEIWNKEAAVVIGTPDPYPGSWKGLIVPMTTPTGDPSVVWTHANDNLGYDSFAVPSTGFALPGVPGEPVHNLIWPTVTPVFPDLDASARNKRIAWE